jgi:hypothetical protein
MKKKHFKDSFDLTNIEILVMGQRPVLPKPATCARSSTYVWELSRKNKEANANACASAAEDLQI